eukprot:TRINITY_DN68412_c0_g1_i1.p1 TRINITY_DN68412_c0_g1~~TRINITY_DN68412_c0_g1_i1.p1  ORF type:complete len:239 (-),score=23.60 TRINITY_DN68412_c0_g1_i1:85-801(-)
MLTIGFVMSFLFSVADSCQVRVDGTCMDVRKMPTLSSFDKYKISYIEGTRAYDSLRFAYSDLPFHVHFTDSENHKWEVTIEDEDDEVSVTFPVANSEIIWHGDDRDRTGFDAQTTLASCTFSYTPPTFLQSHGVRVAFAGYKPQSQGYAPSDSVWDKALKVAAISVRAPLPAEFVEADPKPATNKLSMLKEHGSLVAACFVCTLVFSFAVAMASQRALRSPLAENRTYLLHDEQNVIG